MQKKVSNMSSYDLAFRDLVSTKLSIPMFPAPLLARPQLVHRLDKALSHRLTLISAPAGSGKTVLLCQWVAHHTLPVAWLSLAQEENDPVRFWSYVVAACQTVQDSIGRRMLALLQSPELPALEAVLPLLINDLASLPEPFALILEDYHTITAAAVHQTMRWFLDHLPPSIHLILTSRTDPPLALARRRVHQELAELRMADLRFSPQEVSEWFTQMLSLPLSSAQVRTISERTEGWAAALHLAALCFQDAADLSQALATFSGDHRYVLDYLIEEVLAHQAEEVRSFLLQTSILNRLTGSLCDAVTGRSDAQAMLAALERTGLFVQQLDEQLHWYRFHPLLAEALQECARQAFDKEQRADLFRRASSWYERHELFFEAVEMALLAADYELAIRAGSRVVSRLLLTGQHATVARWIEQVPQELRSSQPLLCLALAWARLLLGQPAQAVEPLHEAEVWFERVQDQRGLGQVAAARALRARFQRDGREAVRWGQQALALLAEEDQAQRCFSLLALGYGYRLQGEVTLARQTLLEARLLSERLKSTSALLGATLLQGEVLTLQGALPEAAGCYQQVMQPEEIWMPLEIEASLALGTLLLEWNQLDKASFQLARAQRLSQQYEETSLLARSLLLQARLLQARADSDQAEEAFWRAVVLARQSKHAPILRQASTFQARWWLIQGNQEGVRTFQQTCGLSGEEPPTYEHEEVALTLIRVLLAQGEGGIASHLLERWLALATQQGRVQSQIEILLLLARAADVQSQLTEAVSLLHQSLLLARAGRYCQLFVQEGPALARLLPLLKPRWHGKADAAYLEHLLKAVSAAHPAPASLSEARSRLPMLSPLTPREYKVLRLLAAGLSTREIATELVVSPNTVKTQLQSLYRKLDARNREAALTAARAFQLL